MTISKPNIHYFVPTVEKKSSQKYFFLCQTVDLKCIQIEELEEKICLTSVLNFW
jgi:hypothetical protein